MLFLTLGQAAKETGKQKSTILDAIRSGRLSAGRDDKQQWQIDPAELFRVYPPQPKTEREATAPNNDETPSEIARMLVKEREERERERRQLSGMIDDLKADRDQWRQQATALLTYQPKAEAKPTAPAAAPRSLAERVWLTIAALFLGVVAVLTVAHFEGAL